MKLFVFLISLAVFARGSILEELLDEVLNDRESFVDEFELSDDKCFDKEPPSMWTISSCEEQLKAGKCEARKKQDSPYCRKTCGMCTVTPDTDCEGSWSTCTAACETAAQRTFTTTVAQSGLGEACPTTAEDCMPGDGLCQKYCSKGIANNHVCCAASCGKCGGRWCHKRRGGGSKCCMSTIARKNRICTNSEDTACLIPKGDEPKTSEYCSNGIANNHVCCAASCGKCGGRWCHKRRGGSKCCMTTITRKNRICTDSQDTVCLIPKETELASITNSDQEDELESFLAELFSS